MKKKSLIILGAVALVVIILIGSVIGQYNALVNTQTDIETAQAEVQTLLQKRADKIPNLVATVKGYANHESDTLTAVTQARTAVAGANNVGELQQADDELSRAFSVWVNAVTESYPDLKANQNFTALMDEISSIENEIQYSRASYNEIASKYNKRIRRFPSNIFASMFGFEKVELFTVSEGSQNVPTVEF